MSIIRKILDKSPSSEAMKVLIPSIDDLSSAAVNAEQMSCEQYPKNTNIPTVSVGIMHAKLINVNFHGDFIVEGKVLTDNNCSSQLDLSNQIFSNKVEMRIDKNKILFDGCLFDELYFSPIKHTLFHESSVCFTLQNVMIGVDFHWQRHEDQSFKGDLKLIVHDGEIYAINVLDIESYLFSVISSEMSPEASIELLKAHAVISRSWLLASMENNPTTSKNLSASPLEHIKIYERDAHSLFDVCADDHCQRYQGITRINNDKPRIAIEQTYAQVLTHNGEICDARYSKCCGGTSELFENCWADIHHPYLVPVECKLPSDKYTNASHCCDTRDPKILSQVLNNYDQETVDFYRWRVEYTQEDLSQLIMRRSGIDFGLISDLIPIERGPSGRIVRLKIIGAKTSLVVGKELEIRKWLSESHLYSSAFTVTKQFAEDCTDKIIFTLNGAGWGHGVGLCQIGAAVMGEKGCKYNEILHHYFTDTKLSTLY